MYDPFDRTPMRTKVRRGLAQLAADNLANVQAWLERAGREDQAAACALLQKLALFPVSEFDALGFELRGARKDGRPVLVTVAHIRSIREQESAGRLPAWAGLI